MCGIIFGITGLVTDIIVSPLGVVSEGRSFTVALVAHEFLFHRLGVAMVPGNFYHFMDKAGLGIGARGSLVNAGLDEAVVQEGVVRGFRLSELVVALHSYDKFILRRNQLVYF